MPSLGYRNILKLSCRPLAFNSYKAFLKNKKSLELVSPSRILHDSQRNIFSGVIHVLFFTSNYGQASALKVSYIFKVFGAQSCLINGCFVVWPSNLCLRGIQKLSGFKTDQWSQNFPKKCFWESWILVHCRFNRYFTLITKKKLHFSSISNFIVV